MIMRKYEDPVNIDKSLWLEILNDQELLDDTTEVVFLYLLKCKDYEARGKEIAKAHHVNYQLYNAVIPAFVKRVLQKYPQINPPRREDDSILYWNTPFYGRDEEGGIFLWRLRDELKDALLEKYKDSVFIDKNIKL